MGDGYIGLSRETLPEVAYDAQEPTVRQKLVATKAILENKLAKINEAIEALDKSPEFEKVHNVLSKALGRF